MKKITGALCALTIAAGTLSAHAADMRKMDERLTNAANILNEVNASDKGIPDSILAGAVCVVVVPAYKKLAFGIGGDYGQGVATCRTGHGWSGPVFVKLEGGSFGFQIGGQTTDLILVAENRGAVDHMLSDKFKLGGDAAVAAGPVGRNASAATDATLHAEFLSYSRSQGLFAGLDLTGTYVHQNKDDTRLEYGSEVPFKQILDGNEATPANAKMFVSTVAKNFKAARANH